MKLFDTLFETGPRLGFLGLFLFFAILAVSAQSEQFRIEQIRAGEVNAVDRAKQIRLSETPHSPEELIALVERVSADPDQDPAISMDLLRRALAINPRLPEVHAKLAHLETEQAGRPTEAAIEHLEASFWDCPYCDRDLLRWRLAFVVMYWQDMPEEVRLQAFAGADVLRWWYLDYAFLEQIGKEALAKGIAFNAYQRKIYTPVRPSEIGQN